MAEKQEQEGDVNPVRSQRTRFQIVSYSGGTKDCIVYGGKSF